MPRTRRPRYRVAALLCTATFVGLAALGLSSSTHAAWQDRENVRANLSAAVVPPAVLTAQCQYQAGVLGLGARVVIYWRAPAGYTLADAQLFASTSGLGSVLAPLTGFNLSANTTTTANGYTTTISTNLLGGLLGLGTELELAIVMKDPMSTWTSTQVKVIANPGLLGGGSCRNA